MCWRKSCRIYICQIHIAKQSRQLMSNGAGDGRQRKPQTFSAILTASVTYAKNEKWIMQRHWLMERSTYSSIIIWPNIRSRSHYRDAAFVDDTPCTLWVDVVYFFAIAIHVYRDHCRSLLACMCVCVWLCMAANDFCTRHRLRWTLIRKTLIPSH